MRKRNVIFIGVEDYYEALKHGYMVIMRPMGSKLFRVGIPEQLLNNGEVMNVVKLWALPRVVNGLYFIRTNDTEILDTFVETLYQMEHLQIEFVVVMPDEDTWIAPVTQNLS